MDSPILNRHFDSNSGSSFGFRCESIRSCYQFGDKLGGGGFGYVKEATHRATKIKYAVKIIHKRKLKFPEMLKREIEFLRKLDHQNIIKLYEVFEEPLQLYLVFEYCNGGELFDLIANDGPLSEPKARDLFAQLISAIHHLHSKKIAHRDLKLENLMLTEDSTGKPSLRVIDLGLAEEVVEDDSEIHSDGEQIEDTFTMKSPIGTDYYLPPEGLINRRSGLESDIWACGVILYIMLCGYPPFGDSTDSEYDFTEAIKEAKFCFDDEIWDSISKEAKDLITCCLAKDYQKRPTIDEIKHHSFLEK
mmetsp:Transcript_8166/g.8874  ORF Transcript_8166/g.8874 Transcript_8166/m.8874 type:complete len:304 (-) Transcript_8166:1487-2398(-)